MPLPHAPRRAFALAPLGLRISGVPGAAPPLQPVHLPQNHMVCAGSYQVSVVRDEEISRMDAAFHGLPGNDCCERDEDPLPETGRLTQWLIACHSPAPGHGNKKSQKDHFSVFCSVTSRRHRAQSSIRMAMHPAPRSLKNEPNCVQPMPGRQAKRHCGVRRWSIFSLQSP